MSEQPTTQPVKKESFWDELKRKLFPKARGRDRPADTADAVAQPQTTGVIPVSEEATPVNQVPVADVPIAAEQPISAEPAPTAAAAGTTEKKSFLDKIKDLFKKKEKPAAADQTGAPAAAPAAESVPEQTAANFNEPLSSEPAMEPITTPTTTGATIFDNSTAANPANQNVIEDMPSELQEIPMVIERGSEELGRTQ